MAEVFEGSDGREFRLTDSALAHIEEAHPDIASTELREFIRETIADPEYITPSRTNVFRYYRLFYNTEYGDKYVRVAVKILEDEAFVLTAFFTDRVV